MPSKKIVCLGAGSRYFIRALSDLALTEGLAESEITLYDIDMEKNELMAKFGARLAELSGTGLRVRACADIADAVDGADFAVSSIGGAGKSVGGVYSTSAHTQDMLIPARYGIFQVVGDTGGPAGMMMGLRSIPIYLDICRVMEKRCPEVVFLNHSNPMAVLCRAMIKHTGIENVIGICHGVQGGIMNIARLLDVPPEELETVWIGTNHYHWFTRIRHKGRDVYPEVKKKMAERTPPDGHIMTSKLSEIYGYQIVYPDDGHAIEFYPFSTQAHDAESMPYGLGHHVGTLYDNLNSVALSFGVGKTGFCEAKGRHPDFPTQNTEMPEISKEEAKAQRQAQLAELEAELKKISLPEKPSDPITGEGLGTLIEAIASGRRQVHIVNIPNKGSVPNLPNYAILEMEGVTDSCGVRGIYTGEAPMSLMGLLQKRIAWQELVADAGATGDRNLALQALLLDEAAIVPEKSEAMLDELLEASKELLPQFNLE